MSIRASRPLWTWESGVHPAADEHFPQAVSVRRQRRVMVSGWPYLLLREVRPARARPAGGVQRPALHREEGRLAPASHPRSSSRPRSAPAGLPRGRVPRSDRRCPASALVGGDKISVMDPAPEDVAPIQAEGIGDAGQGSSPFRMYRWRVCPPWTQTRLAAHAKWRKSVAFAVKWSGRQDSRPINIAR